MAFTSTSVSRHHAYLCLLIRKLERHVGSQDVLLNPLREKAACFQEDASVYLPSRITRHAEPTVGVMQRLWNSRFCRLQRPRTASRLT